MGNRRGNERERRPAADEQGGTRQPGKTGASEARVAKADAAARGKLLLAQAEAQLSARFSKDDELFARIIKEAEQLVDKADAEIAEICGRHGIGENFRPSFNCYWSSAGRTPTRGAVPSCENWRRRKCPRWSQPRVWKLTAKPTGSLLSHLWG